MRFDFASDNTAGMCPEARQALLEADQGHIPSYGNDEWTQRASDAIRRLFEKECEVFFVFNGTAANSLALASLCQSYHSVICHELAHVETDECGAPEFFSNGTKLLLASGEQGKLHPPEVERLVKKRTDIHYPKPKTLTITQSTECGTVYSLAELEELRDLARSLGLKIHMDGARFANACAGLDESPGRIVGSAGVDVLSLGGCKMGMALGEAVVFFNLDLAEDFAYRCKQAGQLASKMRYLTAPWVGMLTEGNWLRHARHANGMARRLGDGLKELGIEVLYPVQSNAVFVTLGDAKIEKLRSAGWAFYQFIGTGGARFVCPWNTSQQAVDDLLRAIRSLSN
ncbi:MAG: low specificity L-threonine aldolase [Candidatus Eremiobacteraeota bacterium]|nr:low specificity L-threonine aldolase [Candidatus Eremiobacteraeota bacterium]MCW5867235.1 low specificity L-threonine aldolase [Candidatus Eremiobacteraeota bacterium]